MLSLGFVFFFIESTQQDCIDLIKNTVKHQYCEGITDLISCFVFEYVSKMYFILVIAKLFFSASIFQSSLSQDPSEIILIC